MHIDGITNPGPRSNLSIKSTQKILKIFVVYHRFYDIKIKSCLFSIVLKMKNKKGDISRFFCSIQYAHQFIVFRYGGPARIDFDGGFARVRVQTSVVNSSETVSIIASTAIAVSLPFFVRFRGVHIRKSIGLLVLSVKH